MPTETKSIYQIYSPAADITTILEDTYENKNLLSTEVKGFYFGQPDEEGLETYHGKLKAEFTNHEE